MEKILAEKEKAIIKEQEKMEYEETRLDIFSYTKDPPFLYIDYSEDYIEIAEGFGYKTIKIEKKSIKVCLSNPRCRVARPGQP